MIPARAPYVARYLHQVTASDGKTRKYYTTKPVIAWDDDGHPLVAGRQCLIRASHVKNFVDIKEEAAGKVVAALPATGWVAEYEDDNGGLFTTPITAWAVKDNGDFTPVSIGGEGWSDDATNTSNFVRLIPPDGERENTADAT